MTPVPPARHLLRARDLADRHYAEPIGVCEMAGAAGLSRAHFSREFSRTFGESPKAYLMTRRLERAGALLRNTDRSVSEICLDVGLVGLGSFTTSFKAAASAFSPRGSTASSRPSRRRRRSARTASRSRSIGELSNGDAHIDQPTADRALKKARAADRGVDVGGDPGRRGALAGGGAGHV